MQLADHESFFKYFCMSPHLFENLLRLVAPMILKSDQKRKPISPAERLAVTLRYLATGASHQTIAFSYRLGHSTVNKIIPETCHAIWTAHASVYIQSPSTPKEWKDRSGGRLEMQCSDWLAISGTFLFAKRIRMKNKTSERVKFECERSDVICERSDTN